MVFLKTMKQVPKKLKSDAPEGTIWFGGPIDRSKVSLRIFGKDLNPEEISRLLKCRPSEAKKSGHKAVGRTKERIPQSGRWSLESELPAEKDLEEKVWDILKRVPSEQGVWKSLTGRYHVDLFCGVFLDKQNRGFGLSVKLMRELSRLGIEIGFDIYGPY